MLRTLGIVQACVTDDEAHARMARRLRGKTVLEWVVRRVTDALQLDGVIVVTQEAPGSTFVLDTVPADVPVHVARQFDPLGQIAATIEAFPAEAAVLVRADNPFVDPGLIDRLVATARAQPDCDYVSYCLRDGRHAILSPVGVYAEWFKAAALWKAQRLARSTADRADAMRYLYSHPERFKLRLIPAPAQIDRDDVRLAVEHEEDWDHALAIFDALGSEEFDWQRIVALLDHQPSLRQRMADLNRTAAGS